MSYSSQTKEELCRAPLQRVCCARAEAHGVLLFCNTFQKNLIRIVTESRAFACRLPKLFHKAFGLSFDRVPEGSEGAGKLVFEITSAEKLETIINVSGFSMEQNLSLHINFGLLEEDCCRTSFLRGVFLAGGSVTDPAKRYHMEFVTSHYKVSRELEALMMDMGFQSRATTRAGNFITYFKQSEHIEDLLTLLGAPVAAMDIMSAKVEKNLRNEMNRRVNCDTANVGKAVDAAQDQLAAIRRLRENEQLENLPQKLQETALMREKYPEMTLSQLAEAFDPPLTKSCLNHRLRKLTELAKKKEESEQHGS